MSDNNLFKNIIGVDMREPDSGPLKVLKARPFMGPVTFKPDWGGVVKGMRARSVAQTTTSPGVERSDVTKVKAKRGGGIAPSVSNSRRPVKK